MTLPKSILMARDEESKKTFEPSWAQGIDLNAPARSGFEIGANWLYEFLSEQVMEFDVDAFTNEAGRLIRLFENEPSISQLWRRMEGIARWQLEQDRASIGLAEQDRDSWKSTFLTTRDAANAHIKSLEKKLAAAEAKLATLDPVKCYCGASSEADIPSTLQNGACSKCGGKR